MMRTYRKNPSATWLVALALLTTVVLAGAWYASANRTPSAGAASAPPAPVSSVPSDSTKKTYAVEASYSYDVTDPERVVGIATDVFVGRVIRQVSSIGLPTSDPNIIWPRTQFAVEVLENIKGDARGTITTTQNGGYDPAEDAIALYDGYPLLVPGRTYVLATYRGDRGWYQPSPEPYGIRLVASADQVGPVVAEYERYRQNEIRYDYANGRFVDEPPSE